MNRKTAGLSRLSACSHSEGGPKMGIGRIHKLVWFSHEKGKTKDLLIKGHSYLIPMVTTKYEAMNLLKQGKSSRNELVRFRNKFPENFSRADMGKAPNISRSSKAMPATLTSLWNMKRPKLISWIHHFR